MIERAASMAFAPGAMVFPGGRVDRDDERTAGGADGAARIAAIRETIEETGVAAGIAPAPDTATVARMRARPAAGTPFSLLLTREGLTENMATLVPFARWRPHLPQRRSFDTRFYLARAGAGREPEPDGTECVSALWTTAAAMLASGRPLVFPTRRILERLARYTDYADAAADAARYPERIVTPWIEARGDGDWLVIPDDLGYPVTAERLDQARRG